MSEIKHPPEPWKMTRADDTDVCIFGADDNWLANVGFNIFNGSIADENLTFLFDMEKAVASRVVACVNACAGVSNEFLERIARKESDGSELFELGKAIAQRDELLVALKALVLFTTPKKSNAVVLHHALLAIAKIETKTSNTEE